MFESREICGKMWQNATMLGGDNVRKEKFKIKCPKRIQFGDPLYYEDFKDKPERLKKLVVDYKPKPEFKAGVLLTEMEYPEFPGYMARTMTVYFAPERYLSTYLDEKMYASQKIEQKEIGVDSARYLIDVDGRYEDIRTGGDGYWGDYQELYREINGKKYVDAVVISISMPDDMSFESMKRLAEYFFEDMSPDREPKKADKKKGRDR